MPAELKGRITIDAEDLSRASEKVREFEGTVESFFARHAGAGRRAELAITASLRELVSGNFGGAIEAIAGHLTGLGLIGGVVATGLIQAGTNLQKTWQTAQAAIKGAQVLSAAAPGPGAGAEQIKKHLEDTTKSIQELEKQTGSGFGATMTRVWDAVIRSFQVFGRAVPQQEQAIISLNKAYQQQATDLDKLDEAYKKANQAEYDSIVNKGKMGQVMQAQIQAEQALAKLHSETKKKIEELPEETLYTTDEEKRRKARDIALLQREDMIESANIQQKMLEQIKAKGTIEPFKPLFERAQLTFQELLQVPGLRAGGPIGLQDAARKAREAQQEIELGTKLRGKGAEEEAFMHFWRAEQIKAGISQLRESEKTPEFAFRSAIDSATVFQEILRELQSMNDKGPVDLTNK